MPPISRARGWWRALFVDHPGIALKSPDGFAGDKHKVWCRKCFDARISSEIGQDEAEVAAGMRTSVRDRQTIENTLWGMGPRDPGRGWQASATQTLLNHLKGCSLQPDDIRQAAEAYSAQKTHSPYRRPPATFPHPQMGHHNMSGPSTIRIRHASMRKTEGCEVTLQCDGWTGINNHHYIAFMMTTSKRELYTIRVHDASDESKSTENLLALVRDVKAMVEKDWKVKVIALTTDCSGESKKTRRVAVEQDPTLVGPDCYGHQINLVVGNYLACEKLFVSISPSLNKAAVSVLRIILTRWTAHFLAYRRLLDLRQSLEIIATQEENCADDQKLIIKGRREAKEQARKMLKLIQNPDFWHSIARVKNHLEPLAVANNIAQSAHCRLDQVLLMFGLLVMKYTDLKLREPNDATACDAILNSLKMRWANADQDVFIAAVLLNPVHKAAPFVKSTKFTAAAIYSLFSRLWTRFYNESIPDKFYEELKDYFKESGQYEDLKIWIPAWQRATEPGQTLDPIECYDGLKIAGQPRTPLQTLACRIFTICANSASVERLFSLFGQILTKLRSRLRNEAMVMLAELKLHIRDEYKQNDLAKARLKRHIAGAPRPQPKTETQAPAVVPHAGPVLPTPSCSQQQLGLGSGPDSATLQADDALASSAGPAESSLDNIVQSLLNLINAENDKESRPSPTASRIKLAELFDFTVGYWSKTAESTGSRGLQDELEFYELLDMDASGELDTDVAVDGMSEAVLMSN
ncbi:ribonuclease H-like domain-containing protein [Russula emetica]|nr:ribonuclease H-like domain-containing protein [Russula emetica]